MRKYKKMIDKICSIIAVPQKLVQLVPSHEVRESSRKLITYLLLYIFYMRHFNSTSALDEIVNGLLHFCKESKA